MKKNETGGGYTLSTGRHVNDAAGGIGIDDNLEVYAGHDTTLDIENIWSYEDNPWTPAEKIELADYMISLWARFRASVVDYSKVEFITFEGCTFEQSSEPCLTWGAARDHSKGGEG